jgi:hypothetical protein
MTVTTLLDYVHQKIASLPDVARLAVVFDPRAALGWTDSLGLEDEQGRIWFIQEYSGNDLAFRRSQRSTRTIVWVTSTTGSADDPSPNITLNSMMDIWGRADILLDASIVGVIRALVPNETWPVVPLWDYSNILSQNLPAVQKGVKELRRYLPRSAALDTSSVRALALHCLRPDIPANIFLFQLDTPGAILQAYLDLIWRGQWDEIGVRLLQQQALQASHLKQEAVRSWLNIPVNQLAVYIYLRRLLGLFPIPNIANHIRGLGIIDVPVEQLEAYIGRLLERWDRDPIWRVEIIRQAELFLQEDDLQRSVNLLGLTTPEKILEALVLADTPGAIYTLQAEFIRKGVENVDFYRLTPLWKERRNPLLASLPNTPYAEQVSTMAGILDDISFIDSCRSLSLPAETDLARLLDWYVAQTLYDLEYAHARADSSVQYAPASLRVGLKKHLSAQKDWIKSYLDDLDHALAKVIKENWSSYVGHPRLSTYVLWDAVKKRRMMPTEKARLWVVVFDGMRWDTWVRHVRPRLLEKFELVEAEKPYLSLLPSWTMVARTGLLAGKPPAGWKNSAGQTSKNQADLAAQLFNIPKNDRNRQLAFYSGMESDRKLDQVFASKRFPYNVLVYNISDDNLHGIKGNLVELNKVVDTLLDNIIQALTNLIEPDDTVVISSDHGFVELSENEFISVRDDNRWQRKIDGDPNPVRYRYLTSHDIPQDVENQHAKDLFKVSYPGFADLFTVIIGRKWFRRAESRGPEDRYAHGGLSFAEMTVPGAVLKRITQKRIKPEVSFEPETLTILEGETAELVVNVTNKGNVELNGHLIADPEPIGDKFSFSIRLLPGSIEKLSVPVKGYFRQLTSKQVEGTQFVKITLTYKDLDGKEKSKAHRVPVAVTPRTDKVEIDFGGLNDLEV